MEIDLKADSRLLRRKNIYIMVETFSCRVRV